MITLHGAAASRASRSLLALEELGLPYRHAPLKPWSDAADAETLARINSNAPGALADWLARCTGRASWARVRGLP
jgi:hypothetical protein